MKNTFGTSVSLTLFGESHGEEIGAVLDGMAPGIRIGEDFIRHQLALRRPMGALSTGRVEEDRFRIVSGVYEGRTTGTPLCILIPNEAQRSGDYDTLRFVARPGHADYTAYEKYQGFADHRGGGHASGRLTAPIVAAGAIALTALQGRGIRIGTHIARLGGVEDAAFSDFDPQIAALNEKRFAVLDEGKGEEMKAAVLSAKEAGDSIGGILETAVTGLPAGVGEPWFDSLEGVLSHALFSIPAVKGVEFGLGFRGVDLRGSEYNDPFRMEGDRIVTASNHNGGVNGGITNGMPLLFRLAVKPTPSVFREQDTVNFAEGTETTLRLTGRHDPSIVPRARVVADSVTALVLCDLLALRFGTDWLRGEN